MDAPSRGSAQWQQWILIAGLALAWSPGARAQQMGVPGCTPPGPGVSCDYPTATVPTNCGGAGQKTCCCTCPLGGQVGGCTLPPASWATPLSFVGQPMFQYELPQ